MLKSLTPVILYHIAVATHRNSTAVVTTEHHHIRSVFILQYTEGDVLQQVTYLEVNPDFVSWFRTLNFSLLKSMGQGSQDTGRGLLQRTLRHNHNMNMGK